MTFLVGPESVMLFLTILSYLLAARHGSYESRDVAVLERAMWLLPVVAVPLAYSTIFAPGARNWWWLCRANLATYLGLILCSVRIVQGFGAPGTGPKGQEIGVFVVMCLGVVFSSIASTSTGAMILASQKPAFSGWFGAHRFIGILLAALAAVPVAILTTLVGSVLLAAYVGISKAIER